MIYPNHQWWAHAVFRPYLRHLCRQRFHALHLMGDAPALPSDVPVLLLPNHASWWDGFFAYLLNDVLFHRRHYVMILEQSLRKLWFFRLIGGFSVNPQSPKGILETLDFTVHLLQSSVPVFLPVSVPVSVPTSVVRLPPEVPLVVIFPQGELRASWVRPLGYTRGVEKIIKKIIQQNAPENTEHNLKTIAIVPLAIRCELLEDEKPHIFLECGAARIVSSGQPQGLVSTEVLEREQEALLARLRQRVEAGEVGRLLI